MVRSELWAQKNTHHNIFRADWFLLRKMSIPMWSGVSRVCSLFTVSPAAENTLSDGTDVPGLHKHCLADLASLENLSMFVFHQLTGLTSRGVGLSQRKFFLLCLSTVGCIWKVLVPKEYYHGCSGAVIRLSRSSLLIRGCYSSVFISAGHIVTRFIHSSG